MHALVSKFTKPIRTIFIIYYESTQEGKVKKWTWFFHILIVFNFYEFIKAIFHGITNNNMYRFYMADSICTFKPYQIIFNFSLALIYFFMIKISLKILLDYDAKVLFNERYLDFLNFDNKKKLIKVHHFNEKEARDYFKILNFLIHFEAINEVFYNIGCFLGYLRILYFSYLNVPRKIFFFSTIPNAVS